MTWQLALAVAAALFGALVVWQNRPSLGPRKIGKARRQALADARARLAAATTPTERVTSALGYYLRAMRTDPTSTEPIQRAARGLARRPRALEKVLWRRLGGASWEGPNRPAAIAALTELARVYGGPFRNRSRAHAISHALVALGQPAIAVPAPAESAADLAKAR
jgi:hypothetical protein